MSRPPLPSPVLGRPARSQAHPRRISVTIAGEEVTLRALVGTVLAAAVVSVAAWAVVVFVIVAGTP